MKVLFRISLIIVVLLLLAAAAATYLTKNRAEQIKEAVLRKAEKRIGRSITAGEFGGNPFTGFHVDDVVISGSVASAPDSITLDRLGFRLSFKDLLHRKLVFNYMLFDKPVIFIEKNGEEGHSLSDVVEKVSGGSAGEKVETPRTEGEARVIVNRITVRDGRLVLRIHSDEKKTQDFVFDIVSASAVPVEEGSMKSFNMDAEIKFENIELNASGKVNIGQDDTFDIAWKTNEIATVDAPGALDELKKTLDEFGIHAQLRAEGTLKGGADDAVIGAKISMGDVSAFDQIIGGGGIDVTVRTSDIKFDGVVGGEKTEFTFNGGLSTGEQKSFRLETNFKGIEVKDTISKLFPDMPEVATGLLSGKAFLSGPGLDPQQLELASSITVTGGHINYPTPTLDKQTGAWAPIKYDTIKARIFHTGPKLEIKDFSIKGPSISASGKGTLKYEVDKETGDAAGGPMDFYVSASLDSPQVRAILMQNPYLGPFVSGEFTGTGTLEGTTGDPSSFKGAATFVLKNGVVSNPYGEKSTLLKLNETLSKFEFHSLAGKLDIADENINVAKLDLISDIIDMNMRGVVGFDSSLNAHAGVALKPEMLGKINDFKAALDQLENLKDLQRVETSFNLYGTLTQPVVRWEVDDLLRREARTIIEKKTDKLINKILEKNDIAPGDSGDIVDDLKKKVRDRLKKFF